MGFEDEFASKEERLFSYYISELILGGWVKEAIYQPMSFVLSEDKTVDVFIKKKNHNDHKAIKLLNKHHYKPDWKIIWGKKAEGIFYWISGGIYNQGVFPYSKTRRDCFVPFKASIFEGEVFSYVDIKGETVGRNNSSGITFPLNAKWMLQQHDLFVQKIVVSLTEKGLFYRTFFPRRTVIEEVYKRDYTRNGELIGKKGDSKIKVDIILMEKFIKNHK